MRTIFFALTLAALILFQTGCAATASRKVGVDHRTTVEPPVVPVVNQEMPGTLPAIK